MLLNREICSTVNQIQQLDCRHSHEVTRTMSRGEVCVLKTTVKVMFRTRSQRIIISIISGDKGQYQGHTRRLQVKASQISVPRLTQQGVPLCTQQGHLLSKPELVGIGHHSFGIASGI